MGMAVDVDRVLHFDVRRADLAGLILCARRVGGDAPFTSRSRNDIFSHITPFLKVGWFTMIVSYQKIISYVIAPDVTGHFHSALNSAWRYERLIAQVTRMDSSASRRRDSRSDLTRTILTYYKPKRDIVKLQAARNLILERMKTRWLHRV